MVGYTDPADKDFLKILSVLGIIHLFSLSGLHVLLILTLIRKLTSFLKIPLELIDTLMLFLLPSYGILVGSKSGIWRAVVLAMVGIVFKKLGWSLSSLDIFSVTLLICLFVDPLAITTMGGQLSFLLAFAIMYLYKNTKFICATLKMNLVSLPIICFYTYQLNLLTLLVNLIFIPLFTYVILPLTFISALSVKLKIWNNVNDLFEGMYGFLDYFSNGAQFILVTGKLAILSVILLVIISLFYIESKSILNKYLYQYLIVFAACIMINKFPLSGSVNIIDVGQGDSILVTTPLIRKTFYF
ncbi:ComEC/Rec2 family competence protein [Companilactobacillus bobalius]|uniref:ComEC/Rec2 family competence protein n=1 Tax=Companilactobacillus bobalius TaxID=2801451 RepID=UPI002278BC3B|nr:ComEC/Rec2 family competence protein [Companilactobacillus bobalius]